MNIITNKNVNVNKIPNTCIVFDFKNDISEYIGDILPYPTTHFIQPNLFRYVWTLKGFFGTKTSIDFYNDIISRFYLTFKDYGVNHNKTYRTLKQKHVLELKRFQGLKSITNTFKKVSRFDRDNKEDYVFWCLKDYSELMINEKGIITYNELLDFGYLHFKDYKKGFSTIKSKCRSIVNYYINNDYKVYKYQKVNKTKEEIKMTRQENIIKLNEKTKQENIRKVKQYLSGNMFIEELKKKNGKWNITRICKDLKISRPTLTKIINEEQL